MRILIGNAVSFVATVFLFVGGIAKDRRGIYFFQFLECIFLIISQLVFFQVAGALSMAFSAARNHLASKDKFTAPSLIAIFIANALFGILLNTGGAVGLIPVFASLFLTVSAYFLHEPHTVRVAVMLNLSMWIVYSFIIRDYVTAISNLVALAINAYTLTRSFSQKSPKM